jgi:hypothetical protein
MFYSKIRNQQNKEKTGYKIQMSNIQHPASRILYLVSCTLYLFTLVLLSGCSSKLSPMFSESWSVNFALASNGAKATSPEINDGKIDTWGVTQMPKREYILTLPEIKEVNRVIIYSGNMIAYELFCWDNKENKWVSIGGIGPNAGSKKVYSDKYKMTIPRFDHRINFKTDKIKLMVDRTQKDGIMTTRTPAKNDKIINQRTEYMQVGRDRVRVDLYDVFAFGVATVREIEVYSHVKKPKSE